MIPTNQQYCSDPMFAGSYENMMLYRACLQDWPDHQCLPATKGKLIAIGRIYAAQPERGAGIAADRAGPDLHTVLAQKLRDERLDEELAAKAFTKQFSTETIDAIVALHGKMVAWIADASRNWSAKPAKVRCHTSFASKYLHFHRPNAFPIMDSRAKNALKGRGYRYPARYLEFCEAIQAELRKFPDTTLRGLDAMLWREGAI